MPSSKEMLDVGLAFYVRKSMFILLNIKCFAFNNCNVPKTIYISLSNRQNIENTPVDKITVLVEFVKLDIIYKSVHLNT